MTLKGKLENFGLGELLQTLALNRHTGTLVLERDEEHKKIYFSTGAITLLSTGQSVRIGDILQREGCVTEEQLEQAFSDQQASGKLFGQILIEHGFVTLEDVQRALRKKVEEEIYDLFLWPDGSFEFLSDYCPTELMDPLQRFTQLKIDPSSLIMEGLRQLDEYKLIRQQLPDHRLLIQKLVDAPPVEITPEATEIWALVPDTAPIADVLGRSPLTRFYTMEYLHKFVQEGWIRPLDFYEHLAVARDERKVGNADEAANLYRVLLETQPRARADREFLKESGFFLADMKDLDLAIEALESALDAYLRSGEHSVAWNIGLRLIELETQSLDLLRSLWPSHTHGSPNSVIQVFGHFTRALYEAQEHDELELVLDESRERMEEHSSYWVLRGDNARALGGVKVAAEHFEKAIDYLREGRDDKEIIRLLRAIYDLDPDREDIADRLKRTLGRQALREATRRRRNYIALGIGVATVLIFAFVANYEVQARRMFDNARTLEIAYALDEQSLANSSRSSAIEQFQHFETHQSEAAERIRTKYESLAESYPLSSRAERAREALGRLEQYESVLRREVERIARDEEAEERKNREILQAKFQAYREEEAAALDSQSIPELRRIREKMLAECKPLIEPGSILYPVLIETDPVGASIEINGSPVGKTPLVHEFSPGSEFRIALSRVGCEPRSVDFTDNGQAIVRLKLKRTPLEARYFPPVDEPVVADGQSFYISCRDGWLYATPDNKMVGHEASWRLRVGVAGHPSATLKVIGSDLLVASHSGVVQRVPISGQPTWATPLNSPLRQLALSSENEQWIAIGDEWGGVHLLDSNTGEVRSNIQLEFPIEALSLDKTLRVVTRRNDLITLALPNLSEIERQTLSSPGVTFAPSGELLLSDGTLLGADGSQQELPAPRGSVYVRAERLAYTTDRGALVVLADGAPRVLELPTQPISPPIFVDDTIFVTGRDGQLHAYDNSGVELWSIEIQAPPSDIRLRFDNNYLVLLKTGGLMVVERTGK